MEHTRNPPIPADLLPTEMLQHIMLSGQRSLSSIEALTFISAVSQVSQFWRHAALSLGELWATWSLSWPKRYWELIVSRTGDRPVEVLLFSSKLSLAEVTERVKHYSSKVHSMKLMLPRDAVEDADRVLECAHFPELRSLEIHIDNKNHINRHPREPDPFEIVSITREIPNLRLLNVRGVYVVNIPLVASKLHHLSIDLSDCDLVDWLFILQACLSLRSLSISWDLPSTPWEWNEVPNCRPLVMPYLRDMSICAPQPSVLVFANLIRPMALRTLSLEFIDYSLLWDRSISGISPFVSHLYIYSIYPSDVRFLTSFVAYVNSKFWKSLLIPLSYAISFPGSLKMLPAPTTSRYLRLSLWR